MSFRSSGAFGHSDVSNRRTWHHRPSFRGARSRRDASTLSSSSVPDYQLLSNRGRRFFRGNAKGRVARRSPQARSTGDPNAIGGGFSPWISAVNDTNAVTETHGCTVNATRRIAASLDETSEIMKACFDTDLRFPCNLKPNEQRETRTLPENPYRLIDAQTSKLLDEALPILQSLKSSNPWQQVDIRTECSMSREEGDGHHSIHGQVPYQALAQRETGARMTTHFEEGTSHATAANRIWDRRADAGPSQSYFQCLKQKEQQKMSFGVSNPPLLQHQGTSYVWDKVQNGAFSTSSLFAKSESVPSFGAVRVHRSPLRNAAAEAGSPGTPVNVIRETWRNPQFQTDGGHTWRQQPPDGDGTWSPAVDHWSTSWRDDALGTPDGQEVRHVENSRNVEEHYEISGNLHTTSGNSEAEETSEVDPFEHSFAGTASRAGTSSMTHLSDGTPERYRARQQQDDVPPDVHCAQMDDGQSQAEGEVHEVDEAKLLPSDVDLSRLKYVLFFDINRKSFFEEVQKPFLPGSLLYLFYQDPAMLLPTKGHPFYKENTHNWVHFYPDCGTEYGSYQLAAPAVISWMDQVVASRVKFLVHGHQKQLKLDNMHRKVLYYPTSRVIDVTLLNRMLNGDFDAPRTVNAGSTTGGAQMPVARPRAPSGYGETASRSAAYSGIGGRSISAQEATRDGARPLSQSQRGAAVHEGPPTRKKICWDR